MAALSITAANVSLTTINDGQFRKVKAGEAITQGQPVYRNVTDESYYLAAATTAAKAVGAGIAYGKAAIGEYFWLAESGTTLDIGATVTIGETYILGSADGGLYPVGDSTSGWYKTVMASGITTSSIYIDIVVSGVPVP